MDLRKGNYISRIWFFSKPGVAMDILGSLHRELPDGPWTFSYRFRYYKDEKAFESDDEKSRWTATFPEKDMTESQAIRKLAPVIQQLKITSRMNFDITVIETDDPMDIMEKVSKKPYFNIKMFGPEN